MFLPAVEVLERGGLEPQPPVHRVNRKFVETPDSNARFLHHIGNADAFETAFREIAWRLLDDRVCVSALSLFE